MSPVKEDQIQSLGPGTHLHRLLAAFGVRPGSGCDCEDRMAKMDRQGVDWCRENLDVIADWLVEEARERQFLNVLTRMAPGVAHIAARRLIWQAIVLAKAGQP